MRHSRHEPCALCPVPCALNPEPWNCVVYAVPRLALQEEAEGVRKDLRDPDTASQRQAGFGPCGSRQKVQVLLQSEEAGAEGAGVQRWQRSKRCTRPAGQELLRNG